MISTQKTPARVRKSTVFFIVMTVVIDAMGIGLIIPVLPDLLLDVLPNTSVAEAAVWGGVLSSLFAIMQFIFSPILGTLSDQSGRKPVLLLSLTVMVGYYLVMALAQSIWLLLIGRVIGGITAATNATAAAYMADISKPEEKAARFGLIGAGFGVGFVLGPVLGGVLGELGHRAPFYAAAALAALNALIGFLVLPETVTDQMRRKFSWQNANPLGAMKTIGSFSGLKALLIVLLIYSIGTAVYPSVWPFFTAERFDWSPRMIGISLTIYGLCFAIVQGVLVRPAITRLGERNTVILGFGFEIFAMSFIAFVSNGMMLMAMTPIASLGVLSQPALQAIMSRRISDDMQGALQGVLSSLHAVAMIVTPLVMTSLLSLFSRPSMPVYFPGAPFLLAAMMVVACLIIFMRLRNLLENPTSSTPQ